jgi:hypothetical protein
MSTKVIPVDLDMDQNRIKNTPIPIDDDELANKAYVDSKNNGYTHNQVSASSTWTVNHNLGYKPAGIIVFDSGGTEWKGKVIYISDNVLTIDFNGFSFGGIVYIS